MKLDVSDVHEGLESDKQRDNVLADLIVTVAELHTKDRVVNDVASVVEELELVLLQGVTNKELGLSISLKHGLDGLLQLLVELDLVLDQQFTAIMHVHQLLADIIGSLLERIEIVGERRDIGPVGDLERL